MQVKKYIIVLVWALIFWGVLSETVLAAPAKGWHYDGQNWSYTDPTTKEKFVGHHQINHVDYYFAPNGDQILPYRVNYQYQLSNKQGTNQQANNKYIILHDVGSNEDAKHVAQSMKKNINTREAYTTFIVGNGGRVYQLKAPGTVSWGAGVNANANSPVQIELERTHNPVKFLKDYVTYIRLARDMAGKYNIPLTLDAGTKGTPGIKSHVWVTKHIWGTHKDPYEYLVRFGVFKWMLAWNLHYGL